MPLKVSHALAVGSLLLIAILYSSTSLKRAAVNHRAKGGNTQAPSQHREADDGYEAEQKERQQRLSADSAGLRHVEDDAQKLELESMRGVSQSGMATQGRWSVKASEAQHTISEHQQAWNGPPVRGQRLGRQFCNTSTLEGFTLQQLEDIETASTEAQEGFISKVIELVSKQNLPGPKGKTIWDEIRELRDVGCIENVPLGKDIFGKHDRHSLALWKPTMECSDAIALGGTTTFARKAISQGPGELVTDDGQRGICHFSSFNERDPCIIYSLGSAGDFSFEESVLAQTKYCKIYTFDCTLPDKEIHSMRKDERLWFYPWCVSIKDEYPSSNYFTIATIMQKLKHQPGSLALLKVDIEGFELGILSGWRSRDLYLPEQILLEQHCATEPSSGKYRMLSLAEQTGFLQHMMHVGYRLVSSRWEGGGLDATFVRVLC